MKYYLKANYTLKKYDQTQEVHDFITGQIHRSLICVYYALLNIFHILNIKTSTLSVTKILNSTFNFFVNKFQPDNETHMRDREIRLYVNHITQ